MGKKSRKGLSIRLQMNEGTPLDEVRQWLESLDPRDKHRKIEDILVMCLLTYARLDSGEASRDELVRTCLECCDTGEKHFSTIRQILHLASTPMEVEKNSAFGNESPKQSDLSPDPAQNEPNLNLGKVSTSQLDELFGD